MARNTLRSPTGVTCTPMPASRSALCKPRLLITVATTRPPGRTPAACIWRPNSTITSSPSRTVPRSSAKMPRSPSPSRQMPRHAPCSTTAAARRSGCRAPQPSLMLKPSGSQHSSITSAPNARRMRGASCEPPPLAASMQTLRPLRSRSGNCSAKNSSYLTSRSLRSRVRACRSSAGRSSTASVAISASSSSRSLVPSAAKILMPLSCDGLCDALIMMPAANGWLRVR